MYYHYVDELITIRRYTASFLKLNESEEIISLRSCTLIREVKTVELVFEEEEAAEVQWLRRMHPRFDLVCSHHNEY